METSKPSSRPSSSRGNKPPAASRGLTWPGEVKGFTPVTDAMLRNPDPADWLMIRHDYHASNFSPLNTRITAQNAGRFAAARGGWASMNEGTNQPAPVVHNRRHVSLIMRAHYLQALDARTGELIWENRIGTAGETRSAASRSRRQDHCHHRRGSHLGYRRAHRQGSVEHADYG